MTKYHLAQINVARFRAPQEDPVNADFVNALDRVNAIAETQPGFIWRLVGDGNDALDIRPFEDDPQMAVNMSVWRDINALAAFTYRNPEHLAIMRRRREWFEKMEVYLALWWVPAGTMPTVADGLERVDRLRERGPTVDAFTFRSPFASPDGVVPKPVLDECA